MHPDSDSSGNKAIFPEAHFHIRLIHKWMKTFITSQALHANSSVLDYLHRFAQIANPLGEIKNLPYTCFDVFSCNCPFSLITQDPMCLLS